MEYKELLIKMEFKNINKYFDNLQVKDDFKIIKQLCKMFQTKKKLIENDKLTDFDRQCYDKTLDHLCKKLKREKYNFERLYYEQKFVQYVYRIQEQ